MMEKNERFEGFVKYVGQNKKGQPFALIESRGKMYYVSDRTMGYTKDADRVYVTGSRVSFVPKNGDGFAYANYVAAAAERRVRRLDDETGLSEAARALLRESKVDLWRSLSTCISPFLKKENGREEFFADYSGKTVIPEEKWDALRELADNVWDKRQERIA